MDNEPNDAWAGTPDGLPVNEQFVRPLGGPNCPAEILFVPESACSQFPDAPQPVASPLRQRGHPLVAWTVIAGIVALTIGMESRQAVREKKAASVGRLGDRSLDMQMKYLVGAAEILPGGRAEMGKQLDALDTGPFVRRLKVAILYGEFDSPKRTLAQLDILEKNKSAEDHDVQLAQVVRELYTDYEHGHWGAPSVSEARRTELRKLGWCGELALVPRQGNFAARASVMDAARQSFVSSICLLLVGALAFFLGLVGVVCFGTAVSVGSLRANRIADLGNGGIYAETFAVWLAGFVLLSLAHVFVPRSVHPLVLSCLLSLLGLSAVFWPRLRAVPWRETREEIGLQWGRPLAEIGCGMAGYISLIPPLLLMTALTAVVMTVARRLHWMNEDLGLDQATHPIVEYVQMGSWRVRLLVLFLASVVAPLTEEIMFRGFLYRHLRCWTKGWRVTTSVLASALASSLVFAAIHPQGMIGVPMLSTLAIGFCLLREWRGSLLAPMVAHGVNNGVITLVMILWA